MMAVAMEACGRDDEPPTAAGCGVQEVGGKARE